MGRQIQPLVLNRLVSAGDRINNFQIIAIIDKVGAELIYRVQCVCSSIGKISETGLTNRISCGCTKFVFPHRLGLKFYSYTFVKFLGDKRRSHFYEIYCDVCKKTSQVACRYGRKKCPVCWKSITHNGVMIDLQAEADRIGIHINGLYSRIATMPIEKALAMPRNNNGGKKGIHGTVYFQNILDDVPNHLRRIGKYHRRRFVYHWIRKGVDPSVMLDMALNNETPVGQEKILCGSYKPTVSHGRV